MKSAHLALFIICVSYNAIYAQSPFFNDLDLVNISINFKGACGDGKNMLIYGNSGAIIRSLDNCATWERTDINDTLHIIGMAKVNNNYIGLCSKEYYIKSSDEGATWQINTAIANSTFYQMIARDGLIYALTNSGIVVFNSDMTIAAENQVKIILTPYASFALATNHFIISTGAGEIVIMNALTAEQEIINISNIADGAFKPDYLEPVLSDGTSKYYIIYNNKIYEGDISSQSTTYLNVFKDSGASAFHNGNIYHISNNVIDDIVSVSFENFSIADKTISQIKLPGNDRYIPLLAFRSLTFFSDKLIVAVGKNNLAYYSSDGGRNWTLISLFQPTIYESKIFNNKQFRTASDHGFISHSNNGGATWLTQKNYHSAYNTKFTALLNTPKAIIFKDPDNAMIFLSPKFITDSNVLLTNDGGDNVQLIYFDEPSSGNIAEWNYQGLSYDNNYLILAQGCINQIGCWTVAHQLDASLGIVNKTALKDWILYSTFNIDGNLYSLGVDTKDGDSVFTVFYSTDKGRNWDKDFSFIAPSKGRFTQAPKEISCIDNMIFAGWQIKFNDSGDVYNAQVVYKIDLSQKKAEIALKARADGIRKICKIKNRYYTSIYFFKQENILQELIYTDDINSDAPVWKKEELKRFSAPFIPNYENADNPFFISVYDTLRGNYCIYYARQKKQTSSPEYDQLNFDKLLRISAPTPNPVDNIAKMTLNWSRSLNIDNAEVSARNILGVPVANKNDFNLTFTNSYSGELSWNVSNKPPGLYFVTFRIGDRFVSSPVFVK